LDTATCIELLKNLDQDLATKFKEKNINLPNYNNISYLVLNLIWPVITELDETNTEHLLNLLLLKQERKYQINLDERSPLYFANFVDYKVAGELLQKLLFNEAILWGNLTHSKYS